MQNKPETTLEHDLAFLHTSPVHVETFTRISKELASDLRVRHVVAEALLEEARAAGVTEALTRNVSKAVVDAASTGAGVVVCTCSTIGGLAESTDTANKFLAMRIDRAMADIAVRGGPRILVVAALASTLQPTRALLQSSARKAGVSITLTELLVEHAWAYFEQGDSEKYLSAVAEAVAKGINGNDVVVLAQASMAPVANSVLSADVPILSSPWVGVEAAVNAIMHNTRLQSMRCARD
jgi:hypothetical protein